MSDIERDMNREMCTKVDWDWIMTTARRKEANASKGKKGDGEQSETSATADESSPSPPSKIDGREDEL